MTALIILLCLVLLSIVVVQIGRVTELAQRIRGEEESQLESNKWNGILSMIFLVLFLVGCIWSAQYYKNTYLWFGPHTSASEHGGSLDYLFNVTLFFTGIVFIITHIALFYFSYKYQGRKDGKAIFMPHDNKLEVIWTAVPAVVMTFLVISGLDAWNEVMADVEEGEDHIEFQAAGYQFGWLLRYGGPDGKLGTTDFRLIDGTNPLGQDWNDTKNLDDFQPDKIVLPKGKKVRVRITSRDVLHNFYLPHFRVKMDAVPGMPTYFVFTPSYTTAEYRQRLGELDSKGQPKWPEWHEPYDPTDPSGPKRYEAFKFELACAELCGKGHYSMRREVEIVTEEEYEKWLTTQQSWYMTSIRNGDSDPYKGEVLDIEVASRAKEFGAAVDDARALEDAAERIIQLKYVSFETGSATLTANSKYELANVKAALEKFETMQLSLEGHTDTTGDAQVNMTLSQERAKAVYDYLVNDGVDANRLQFRGFGGTQPIGDNSTEDGRAKNRRTELRIVSL